MPTAQGSTARHRMEEHVWEDVAEMVEVCDFPPLYRAAILHHAAKPKSAVGGDPQLQKVVLQLDSEEEVLLLGDIQIGTVFSFRTPVQET